MALIKEHMENRTCLNKNIALIGMPNSGKSTIGKMAADRLHLPFIDTDEYIESKYGETIEDIFKKGEPYFRELEAKAVIDILNSNFRVIATGGGIVKLKDTMELLKQNSAVIFLDRPLEDISKDVDPAGRPLLKGNKDVIYKLYKERYELYKKYSDFVVSNDSTIIDAVDKIIKIYHGIK